MFQLHVMFSRLFLFQYKTVRLVKYIQLYLACLGSNMYLLSVQFDGWNWTQMFSLLYSCWLHYLCLFLFMERLLWPQAVTVKIILLMMLSVYVHVCLYTWARVSILHVLCVRVGGGASRINLKHNQKLRGIKASVPEIVQNSCRDYINVIQFKGAFPKYLLLRCHLFWSLEGQSNMPFWHRTGYFVVLYSSLHPSFLSKSSGITDSLCRGLFVLLGKSGASFQFGKSEILRSSRFLGRSGERL